MNYFVGNKSLFGIEFLPLEDSSQKRGIVKIWLNSFSIGDPLDDDFFFVLVNQFRQLSNNLKYYFELDDLKDDEIFEMLISEESGANYDATILQLGESFDQYHIRSFLTKSNKIKFLVSAKNIDNGLFNVISVELEKEYLAKIIDGFVSILTSIYTEVDL